MNTVADRYGRRVRRRPACPAAGFTLVEVVVSVAILSLIMVATVAALRTFGTTQRTLDSMTGRVDDMRSVSRFLRDTLDGAVIASERGGTLSLGPGSTIRPPPYFKGGTNFLAWKAPIMFGEAYGGVFLVRVAREGDQLVLRWLESTGKAEDEEVAWAAAPSRVLLEQLEMMQITYLGDFGLPLTAEWEEEGSPALVTIRIKAAGRFWPELSLRVQR